MSDAVGSGLSVLLPSAVIHVFSVHEDTRDAILKLKMDWRFARVEIQAFHGDVEDAKRLYEKKDSPNLLIVETETTEDEFAESLENLAVHCREVTSAMVVGPVNDISLYRKLVGMGVSDYLVRPIDGKDLSDIIAKSLIDKIGILQSTLISVIGAKGGVGTSSITYSLSDGLSEEMGQKVLVMDCGGGWSYLARAMGRSEPTTTLLEASKMAEKDNEDGLNRLILESNDKLSYLSTGIDGLLDDSSSAKELEVLLDKLMIKNPVLCIDLSMAPTNLKKLILRKSQRIIVVTNVSLPSIRSSRSLIKEISSLRGGDGNEIRLVINMKGFLGNNNEVNQSNINELFNFDPSLVLDYEPKIWGAAECEGVKLSEVKGGENITSKITSLVSDMFEPKKESVKIEKGGLSSLLGKLGGS